MRKHIRQISVTATVLVVLLALAESTSTQVTTLTFTYDRAFIDNRPTVATVGYDDPLLPGGLNLNVEVGITDSVVPLEATVTPSNPSFPSFPGFPPPPMVMSRADLGGGIFLFQLTRVIADPSAQFPGLSGTYNFQVTDANGSFTDVSHTLNYLVVLGFPTGIQASDTSTTPVVTFTDPNSSPPDGITRAYNLQIRDADTLGTLFQFPFQLTTSFEVPSGVLTVGRRYHFRAHINDVDTAEIPASLAGGIHDPTESRSVGWFFDFTPQFVHVRNLTLAPLSATNPVGTTHTVTATATDASGVAVAGAGVTFSVIAGPNASATGTGTTDANGQATFTYSDTGGAGTDTIQANSGDVHSNTAQKVWQPQGQSCPLTQGFWKNHPSAWPVTSLTLGSQTYTQTELLLISSTAAGSGTSADASVILAYQLIAAKLNIANGSDPAPISATIAGADAVLSGFAGKLPYSVKPSSATGQSMVDKAATLDGYNSGQLTPNCIP
jgi:hypothetical protein